MLPPHSEVQSVQSVGTMWASAFDPGIAASLCLIGHILGLWDSHPSLLVLENTSLYAFLGYNTCSLPYKAAGRLGSPMFHWAKLSLQGIFPLTQCSRMPIGFGTWEYMHFPDP